MDTEKKLNQEIVELTMKIRNKFPELIKYLDELTVSIPDSGQLDIKIIEDYRDTLKTLVEKHQNDQRRE